MVVKYKLKKLPNSTNISNAKALRYKMVHVATYTFSTTANAIPCSQFQKNIQIL